MGDGVACVGGKEIYTEDIRSRSLTRKEKKAKERTRKEGRK
jgi:hypothetical protein